VILNETFNKELGSLLDPGQLKSLRQSLEFANSLSASQEHAVSSAFAQAFAWQFTLAAAIAAASVLISLACWTRRPVDLKGRLEIGERVSKGVISPDEGDRQLRVYKRP